MTSPRGHWLDLLELLLAHLGDEVLSELQALVSGFVLGWMVAAPPSPTIQGRGERTAAVIISTLIEEKR